MNHKTLLRSAVVLSTAGFFASCASLSPLQVDSAAVDKVNKVAIVGYTADLTLKATMRTKVPGHAENSFGKGFQGTDNPEYKATQEEQAEFARASSVTLRKELEQELKWKMLTNEQVASNPKVKELLALQPERKPVGFLNPYNDKGYVPGLLSSEELDKLTHADRVALMDALKVDALVSIDVVHTVREENTFSISGYGTGNMYPNATARLKVYDRTKEEPIWRDSAARGDESTQGVVQNLGKYDEKLMMELSQKSGVSALKKALQRFAEKRQSSPATAGYGS